MVASRHLTWRVWRLRQGCETYVLQRYGAEAGSCAAEMRPHIQAANTRREAATPPLTMQRCLHMRGASGHVRTVLMGDGGVTPPHMARVQAFETMVRDLRTAARRRGGSNMRRGDEATHSGQIQAANTRRESATPALTTQRCWHISSAVGHVQAVFA